MSDFVAVGLLPIGELAKKKIDASKVEGYILAYRQWLPNPNETVGVRLLDDADASDPPVRLRRRDRPQRDRPACAPGEDNRRLPRGRADGPLARPQRART